MNKTITYISILVGASALVVLLCFLYNISPRSSERKKVQKYTDEIRTSMEGRFENYSIDIDYKTRTVGVDIWYEGVTVLGLAAFTSGDIKSLAEANKIIAGALNEGLIENGMDGWSVRFRVVDANNHAAPLAEYVDGEKITDSFEALKEAE